MPPSTDDRPDYARFARQIALPEVGATGQRAVGRTPVRFEGDGPVVDLAEAAHRRAGGLCGPETTPDRVVVLPTTGTAPAALLGVAAAGAVEAARRVLGAPMRDIPAGLRARLGDEGDAG